MVRVEYFYGGITNGHSLYEHHKNILPSLYHRCIITEYFHYYHYVIMISQLPVTLI
jgi:hypothetical protein